MWSTESKGCGETATAKSEEEIAVSICNRTSLKPEITCRSLKSDGGLTLGGGRVNSCFYIIGEILAANQIVCIAEGYATAASVYEATGHTTVVAFQSGNIDKVGIAIRSKYPNLQLVYCTEWLSSSVQ